MNDAKRKAVLVFSISMMTVGSSINLMFLGSIPRFGNSVLQDYFYRCRSCGKSLQWQVDGIDVVSHLATDTIGQIRFRADRSNSDINYLSMLLSLRITNNEVCMTSLLLVTHLSGDTPEVLCRGDSEPHQIIDSMTSMAIDSVIKNDVQMDYLLYNNYTIIRLGIEYITHIFMCNVNGTSLTWMVNGKPGGDFISEHDVATSAVRRYHDALVYTEAALITNRHSKTLSSILVLSGNSSTKEFALSCRSDITELNLVVKNQDLFQPQVTAPVTVFLCKFIFITPHAQRERGKVIGVGVHMLICLWTKKKFESLQKSSPR